MIFFFFFFLGIDLFLIMDQEILAFQILMAVILDFDWQKKPAGQVSALR